MDRQEYIELIVDHYERPRHMGPLADPDVVTTGTNPGCGDVVIVYLRVSGEDRQVTLSFEGQGCTISQAAASMVMEMMQGWTLDQIEAASAESVAKLLGSDIAAARPRCATLALDMVKEAGRRYRQQQLSRTR